ncbi:uncharacterized protein LOC106875618 [Octopus bimaculoides]|uniref:Uncharacterized protein n=1 Tax=Octopus bimaculoides TaxID=37653 RepID=A0A0L8GPE7_OCTBM|nr:uncharacterized protein LOC106875618 [Octopus bimaculoides]|eukprot:XP_014779322.1 PREDICTED: uncharacterized protein LOC106875618 [Octopus bimaculoides]
MCNSARMKVISLFAFYMLMSQGSGASLNGLNQMDKKHEAEELEDQLHLEKRKVKTSSEREMNPEVTTTMEVTTAMDLPLTTELNEENILETLGVNGFVHLVSSVFEHHPQVLKEFLSRKSNLLVKHSSMNGRPTHHHIRPHLPETANSGSYLPAHYKKSNLLNHGPLRRHYNPTEKRHQNHIYQGESAPFFLSFC